MLCLGAQLRTVDPNERNLAATACQVDRHQCTLRSHRRDFHYARAYSRLVSLTARAEQDDDWHKH